MKLTKVEIKNYRSISSEATATGLSLSLAEGMNALVGPNNSGKSNVLRAIALALDPSFPFDRSRDMPSGYSESYPRVTLQFGIEGRQRAERTLLAAAERYERSVAGSDAETNADDGTVRFVVAFPGSERFGATRQESIQVRGVGARQGDPQLLAKVVNQLRASVRFVMIESGQSLEQVLAGNFREILHSVIREHLVKDFERAERRRDEYVSGLRNDLLAPLQDRIRKVVSDLFPEIQDVVLQPSVAGIDETIANVAVAITDSADTSLADKGTGVRGAVVVALLRYLADHSEKSMVFAVEEPEAFLHPAAQEDIRDDLEMLAVRPDVTVVVTTHSPFIVSRDKKAQLVAIDKDSSGRTRIIGAVPADEPTAALLGGLFRDAAIAEILDSASRIPSSAKAVVLVEGTTDASYMRLLATHGGRPELVDDLYFIPVGGTKRLLLEAALLKRQSSLPMIAVLDSDEPGRLGAKDLKKKMDLASNEVALYSELLKGNPAEIEAEDLFPNELLQKFVDAEGSGSVLNEKVARKPLKGGWHYDFNKLGKELLPEFLAKNARKEDLEWWADFLVLVRGKLGLPVS